MKKAILKRSLATRNGCPRPGINKPLECSADEAVWRLLIVVPIRHMPSSNILEIGEHGAPAAVVSAAEALGLKMAPSVQDSIAKVRDEEVGKLTNLFFLGACSLISRPGACSTPDAMGTLCSGLACPGVTIDEPSCPDLNSLAWVL